MYSVYLTDLEKPEYLKVGAQYGLTDLTGFKFVYPQTSRTPMHGGWEGGGCSIVPSNHPGHTICSAHIGYFTSNCGIRAITSPRAPKPLASYFMKLIEAYMIYGGYTYLVASDGKSSMWTTSTLLKEHGWTAIGLKNNRRMMKQHPSSGEMPMELLYKHLDWDNNPLPHIDFASGR